MTKAEFNARFKPNGVWDREAYEIYQLKKDKARVEQVNQELEFSKMAYKVKDSDGNIFVYAGLENGFPTYRGQGGSKCVFDMTGLTVIQQYAN
jgi:hypothetical protein